MGLYTNAGKTLKSYRNAYIKEEDTAQKSEIVKEDSKPKLVELAKPVKKSFYDETTVIKTGDGINYKDLYTIGQKVQISEHNGRILTRNGKIVDIVDSGLMYVEMLDTYTDVNDMYQVAFIDKAEGYKIALI